MDLTRVEALVGEMELAEVRRALREMIAAREEFELMIFIARQSGETLQAIADAAGLTKQRIDQIVKRLISQGASS